MCDQKLRCSYGKGANSKSDSPKTCDETGAFRAFGRSIILAEKITKLRMVQRVENRRILSFGQLPIGILQEQVIIELVIIECTHRPSANDLGREPIQTC